MAKTKQNAKQKEKTKTTFIAQARRKNKKLLFMVVVFVGVLLIVSTYAWFSASLNVKIKFINMKVSTDTGLFISLDGVNFGSEVEVNRDSIIYDLKELYPNHTNQWSNSGLWTVSTNGIVDQNSSKFDVYYGELGKYRDFERYGKRYLNTLKLNEDVDQVFSRFVAFDIFLKNVSGSPYTDNLYFTNNTFFEFPESVSNELREEMSGIMNSARIGIVRIGDTHLEASVDEIQNLQCNNKCEDVIYEPFSTQHSTKSIEDAKAYGISIIDGDYIPTYGVYKEGEFLDHRKTYYNVDNAIDTEHFALQETMVDSDLDEPIFQLPNGIVKCRVYIWIEGQDIDSLETFSKGAPINLNIELEKDLAGYEPYND